MPAPLCAAAVRAAEATRRGANPSAVVPCPAPHRYRPPTKSWRRTPRRQGRQRRGRRGTEAFFMADYGFIVPRARRDAPLAAVGDRGTRRANIRGTQPTETRRRVSSCPSLLPRARREPPRSRPRRRDPPPTPPPRSLRRSPGARTSSLPSSSATSTRWPVTGPIRKAAEAMHIASSAMNRRILDLEDDIGFPLFERLPRGVRATAAGSSFWSTCGARGRSC